MQLIRRKWLEKKPVLRPAAMFGLCDERNTSLATVPVLSPPQLEDGGRQGKQVVFPPTPRACRSHRLSVIRNVPVGEPLSCCTVLLSLPRGAGLHTGLWKPGSLWWLTQWSQRHPVTQPTLTLLCWGSSSWCCEVGTAVSSRLEVSLPGSSIPLTSQGQGLH